MKRSLLFCLGLSASAVFGQIAITENHYTIPISPDSSDYRSFTPSSSMSAPQRGANVHWDYTGLPSGSQLKTSFFPSDNNPNFPNASAMYTYDPTLGSLSLVNSRGYYLKNSNGYFNLGLETSEEKYGLGPISGNNDDTLFTLNTFNYHDEDAPLLLYPLEYNDNFTSSIDNYTDFELTVGSFGLNRTPGSIKQTTTRNDSVVGWGTLSLPTQGYDSVPALLVFTEVTGIDSFFVGGQPASPILLGAFGLTQGSSFTSRNYYFIVYNQDEGSQRHFVLRLNLNTNNEVSFGSYDARTYQELSLNQFKNKLGVSLYPNPVNQSQEITIEFGQLPNETLNVDVFHVSGINISSETIQAGTQKAIIPINAKSSGYYILRLSNQQGETVYTNKVLVN